MPDPGDPVGPELGLREVRSFSRKIISSEIKTKDTDRQERKILKFRDKERRDRQTEIDRQESLSSTQ